MRRRDTQRQRVYDAERRTWPRHWEGEMDFASLAEVQEFVDRVLRSRWWKSRCRIRSIEVEPGRRETDRGRYHDGGIWRDPWISLPRRRWRRWYLLHELAHGLNDWVAPEDVAAHGPHFCANYLELLRRFGDPGDADRLREEFKAGRVKHRRPSKRAASLVGVG